MSHSPGALEPNFRLILVLLAALGALVVAGVSSTASAGASNGGVSASGGGSGTGGKYKRLWRKASHHDKHWARSTSECESGRDPNAIGGHGQYRGAFQFMKSTWRSAPKSPGGDPIDYGFRTQAVVGRGPQAP